MADLKEQLIQKIGDITFDLKLRWALLTAKDNSSSQNFYAEPELEPENHQRHMTEEELEQSFYTLPKVIEIAHRASEHSGWNITPQAIEFARGGTRSEYETKEKILIVQEPHADVVGHQNLFDFLKRLFDDNPGAEKNTVFLAEGTPKNEQISTEDLNEAEPNPKNNKHNIIERLLQSHTITGYTAYEWQEKKGIRITGTEDPQLYALGAELMTKMNAGQASKEEKKTWELTVFARNKSIAQTVIHLLKNGFKPILFVGGKHLDEEPTTDTDKQKNKEHIAALPEREATLLRDAEFKSLDSHFKEHKIGYEFISMNGSDPNSPTMEIDETNYALTFISQTAKKNNKK